MSRRGSILLLLASLSISGLVGIGLLEWFVRYRESHRTTVPGTMPFLFYPHNRLRFALVRGTDYYGWLHINKQGFRGRDVTLEPRAGVIRIMAVGGSTTMDGAVTRDENAWPARLEFWLDSLGSGQRFEVINAGVSGYRVIDNVIRFQTELYRYRPNLIVLYGSEHNDLLAALVGAADTTARSSPRPDELPAITPWGRWLELNSLLYNKVVLRWDAVRSRSRGTRRQQGTSGVSFQSAVSRGAEAFRRDLRAFVALADAEGIPVVIPGVVYMGGAGSRPQDSASIAAVWSVGVPFAPPASLMQGYATFDSVSRAVASCPGATYVPTTSFGLGNMKMYAEDDPVHFGDQGSDRMGSMLAQALLKASPWKSGDRRSTREASACQSLTPR